MLRPSLRLLAVGILACAAPAFGQIIDGFESGTVGSPPAGWTDFGGSQPFIVSNTQAHTGTQSMRLSEGTDTQGGTTTGYGSDVWKNFLPAGGYTSGVVTFSYWQFIDPAVDSTAFMYISTGRMPTTFETGLDLRADGGGQGGFGANMMLVAQDVAGTPTLQVAPFALVKGRWVEHSMTVDLTADRYSYSYDGVVRVSNLEWDRTPSPAGTGAALSGINFWMQLGNTNATNAFVYYDDFNTVVPEPATASIAVLASGALATMRRRRAR